MINSFAPDFTHIPGRCGSQILYRPATGIVEAVAVSVLTPYYNTEDFFQETFVSLQLQTLQNWEWIIVDDGSTDACSVNRLNTLAATDSRIKVLRQANAGPSAARNTAFRNSASRYVCLLDSDDMLEPTYLEKCVWFLESNAEFSFCNSYTVCFGTQAYLWQIGFERGKAYLEANSGPPISVIRRAAYVECGGFDESIRFGHEDWDFWLAMAKSGHWGYTVQEYLQWYRKRGDGRFEQIMRSESANDEFEKLIARKYAGLESSFPSRVRRLAEPFESIGATSFVLNPLAPNPVGRRIMLLVPWMVTGGADRVNLDLIEGLVAKGHQVTLCATLPADHRWEHQFSRFTPDIFILPNILRASDYPVFLAYLIQSRQIDSVLISGSTLGYQFLPYLRAVAPEVAFLDMCHVEEPHWQNGGHPRFGVGYQELLDLNIVTTRHLSEWMGRRGADTDRVKVMYTGIRAPQAYDVATQRIALRTELGIPRDVPVLVFAGRLCQQKRPRVLVEILKFLRDGGCDFRALIIGEGELSEEINSLLNNYHLTSCVQMLGSVAHERWLQVLGASDILLMPSQYEGISIALLEAMAAGVVPVVADVGGQGEIVSKNAGVLVPHGINELQAYEQVLRRLIANSSERRGMAMQCQVLAKSSFSWDAMVIGFEQLLEEAHRRRREDPRLPIARRLGAELAAQALEYKRLGEAVAGGWSAPSGPHNTALQLTSGEAQAVTRVAIAVSRTWFGRKIIRNRFLRAVAKKFVKSNRG